MPQTDETQKPKPTIWLYDLPSIKGEGWARIQMTSDGTFTAVTDWGDYSYWWTAFGDDFRKFMLRVDDSYLIDKFSYGRKNEYDPKTTLEATRKDILERRKTRDISKEDAESWWEELKERFDNLGDDYYYNQWLEHSEYAKNNDEPWLFYHSNKPAAVVAFVKNTIPRLKERLRQDLGL